MEPISEVIKTLCKKYNGNEYASGRLLFHINSLESLIDNEIEKHDNKIARINELVSVQDAFNKSFIEDNKYYYMPYNGIFFQHDEALGKYKIVSEDDIIHKLLTTITHEKKLLQWKYKTKAMILKNIKRRHLLKSIPDTNMIDNVITQIIHMFDSKEDALYFLMCIGDCVMKKNGDNVYFINPQLKKLVSSIDTLCYTITGTGIMSNFITKHHDSYVISNYRLFRTDDYNICSMTTQNMTDLVNDYGIELLVVSCYLSELHISSENYLADNSDKGFVLHSLHFKLYSEYDIINIFIDRCIEKVNDIEANANIKWENMYFIWKQYLSSLSLPNVFYKSKLQTLLFDILDSDKETMTFKNVTSKYLPYVVSFFDFWDNCMTINDSDEDGYEIDELVQMYNQYRISSLQCRKNIDNKTMKNMIKHYFESHCVEIIDDKYVTNVKCKLWNKQDDILDFLRHHKSNDATSSDMSTININGLYKSYVNYFVSKGYVDKKNYLTVSKHFFEQFIEKKLDNHVDIW